MIILMIILVVLWCNAPLVHVALVFVFILKHSQVIAAEGEQKASRALREAAEVIAESPSALQLRSELHTVENFH